MEKALTKTHQKITTKAESAIKPHHDTGITEKSLVKNVEIKWKGAEAYVKTGFSIRNGGLPSIFLMYGTPRIKKDQKLYNAFFGKKTKEEIVEIQKEAFFDEIRRLEL